jgi:hypothetical protein
MTVVHAILDAFKGPSRLADATGIPMKTVFSWKEEPANIPEWRRPAVIDAARREKIQLPAEAWEYLASTERAPKVAA